MRGDHVTDLLWAFSRLEYRPANDELAVLMDHVQPLLGEMEPDKVAGLLWAMPRIRFHPGMEWLWSLAEAVAPRVMAFPPRDAANIAINLAQLDVRAPPLLLAAIAAAVTPQWLAAAEPQHLGKLLNAFGQAHFNPGPDWIARAEGKLTLDLPRMSGDALARSLLGLANLGHVVSRGFAAAVAASLPEHIERLNASQARQVDASLHRLDVPLPLSLQRALLQKVGEGASEYNLDVGEVPFQPGEALS